MKRIILFCTLILITTMGFAAKQDKASICHVGNEAGVGAGLIDLIVVAKADRHLNNDSHSCDGISDYEPSEVGASGGGG